MHIPYRIGRKESHSMKRALVLVAIVALLAAACANEQTIDGKVVESIGLVNQAPMNVVGIAHPVPCVDYQIVWGNVIWGAVLVETVIAPIYFYGFSMFEPIGKSETCTVAAK